MFRSLAVREIQIKRTYMSSNRRMVKDSVINLHIGVFISIIQRNKFMRFPGKLIELEKIILTGVSFPHKEKYKYSIVCIYYLLNQ